MANAAGQDLVHYRRKMLYQHPRAARFVGALDAAAARAGWETPPPLGVHRGIALNEVNGTYNAAVIEVSVGGDALRVRRVVSAIDCGHVVNLMTVEMQVESATVYALTAALYGEITIKDGRVEQSNFHDYHERRLLGRRRRADHLRRAPAVLNASSRRPASASARCR